MSINRGNATSPHVEHEKKGPGKVNFFIITVSTSRYELMKAGKQYTDESGDLASLKITNSGHLVVGRLLVSDDEYMIKNALNELIHKDNVDVIVLIGGTGLAKSDVTIESVRPLFSKEIEGFGELFRFISYQKIGASAMLSRATAGIINNKLIVCLPGSPDAVETGLNLIIDQVSHILYIARLSR
ncbi:MogA/MoaB family molybdenum cofactor biosynthesis protein [Caldivirga maquilingensis]|uniref:Molybdenum cofactor synthesis domain n=1 Tax=Caldivirga maquilingensis (strain ATCC 700844 / DSM 13496 / JCM 10307 / IC-167) TaxID=397948 RepID=A8MAI0_CALMQ|nr:MogA/MoaB family molybdenum cofactor biosynthesis protein [Caldivirga maquilingensis]ABW02557.1 molybdenum cofactor synthesis domain [Caldivirga maquilingensis IC-167]